MNKDLKVELKRTIQASQKKCFEAWLNPETLKNFMVASQGGTCPTANVDARVGGSFLIVMKVGEKEIPHTGEYKMIDPHQRIAFTWLSPHQKAPESLVTLEFKKIDEQTTELMLRHVGFETEGARTGHEGGWTVIVNTFEGFFK